MFIRLKLAAVRPTAQSAESKLDSAHLECLNFRHLTDWRLMHMRPFDGIQWKARRFSACTKLLGRAWKRSVQLEESATWANALSSRSTRNSSRELGTFFLISNFFKFCLFANHLPNIRNFLGFCNPCSRWTASDCQQATASERLPATGGKATCSHSKRPEITFKKEHYNSPNLRRTLTKQTLISKLFLNLIIFRRIQSSFASKILKAICFQNDFD